ncbi:stress response protein [Halorientalis sp. IM1011]|uniref:universal stress protein n=1 Tax=Halorientalis sp. IM1011 TaxID=1932360 RepID=UPI00097CC962|nr:universal stress protein [Halorientalis sp. IM1011]AQL44122.1 stress response protein [Halorientalis sp. IM1011]
MYNRILLPTDGSTEMEPVIDHAAEVAARHDALIHALYVVDAAGFASLPMETSWEGISELLYEEATSALNEVERIVDDQAPVERIVVEDRPHRAIVDHADEDDCDLIVMGTHGRGGIDRLLLGSVAERVVRRAPVPVMTVRVKESPVTDREPEMKA